MLKTGTFALALLAVATAAPAQAPQWEKIGWKTVSGTETDVIKVDPRRDFRQVQLCAFNAPVRMLDFDVRFRNGTSQDVAVRDVIKPGSCTRAIDLTGKERHIERINLRYEKLRPKSTQPLIRVQGR